jgi:hypothetical protein
MLPFENEVNVKGDLKREQIGDMIMHFAKAMESRVAARKRRMLYQ